MNLPLLATERRGLAENGSCILVMRKRRRVSPSFGVAVNHRVISGMIMMIVIIVDVVAVVVRR